MSTLPVPTWLKELVGKNKAALRSAQALRAEDSISAHALHTVCHAAHCPNRGECFNCGDATFMILGDICTRGCRFCAVDKKRPLPPDPAEPQRVADAIKEWNIRYAVLTMPTRETRFIRVRLPSKRSRLFPIYTATKMPYNSF